MLRCRKCDNDRPVFCGGLCNPCYRSDLKFRDAKVRERQNAKCRRWYKENRAYALAEKKAYHAKNYKAKIRDYKLRSKYGITLQEYGLLFLKQKGQCGICDRVPQGKMPLFVDHDHKTKRVRGLLCASCNSSLGIFDNTTLRPKVEKWIQIKIVPA